MASILDPHGFLQQQPGAIPTTSAPAPVAPRPSSQPLTIDALQQQDQSYNWLSDLGHSLAGGTGDMGASLSSAVGWLASVTNKINPDATPGLAALADNAASWRKTANAFAEGQGASMSPAQRELLSQPFFSGGAWSNAGMYLGGHLASMAPSLVGTIAATAMTGGIADAMIAGSAGAAATATGFGAWGALSAGDVINQITTAVDNVPDEKLRSTNPIYNDYRTKGMSEKDARKEYNLDVIGVAPAVAFTIGGLAGVLGGPGQLARRLGKGRIAGALVHEGGLVSRTLGGAAVGGAVGGAQAAATSGIVQTQLVDKDLASFDNKALVDAALSGGALGAVMGGAAEGPITSVGKLFSKKAKGTTLEVTPPEAGGIDAAATEALTPVAPPEAPTAAATPEPVPAPAPAPAAAPPEAARAPEPAPTPAAEPMPAAGAEATPTSPPVADAPAPVPSEVTPTATVPVAAEPAPAVAPVEAPAPAAKPIVTDAVHKKIFASVTGKNDPDVEAAIKAIASGLGKQVKEVRDILRESTKGQSAEKIAPFILDQLRRVVEDQKKNGVETAPKVGHQDAETVQARKDLNLTAKEIADKHPPVPETENAAMLPVKAGGKQAVEGIKARAALEARIRALTENARDLGLPARLRDNVDPERMPGAHTMLLVEAKTLLGKIKSGKATAAEYSRFITNEHLLRSGKVDEYLANRRAEGEAAMKPKGSMGLDNVAAAEPAAKGPDSATGYEASADRVTTKVAASKKARPETYNAETAERVTSTPRKVELSAEEKQALEDRMTAAAKRTAEREAEVPKTGKEKVAEIKAKAKAKPEPKKPASPEKVKAVIEKAKAKAEPKTEPATPKQAVAEAAAKTDPAPTEAQKVAGNYEKGHVTLHGLPITIETPKGALREGVGPDGKPWSVKMPDHYGYIKRTEGADGDHVDVYIGPHPESDMVFLVDQNHTGTDNFDEHKAMLGYKTAAEAMQAYEKAFSDGKAGERFGGVKPMTVEEFKTWLKEGDTTRPTDEHMAATKELAKERGPKLEKLGGVTRDGNANPYVSAHNEIVEWLNGLTDKDFVRMQEEFGSRIADALDETETPEQLKTLRRDLEEIHQSAGDVFGENNVSADKGVPKGWGEYEPGPTKVPDKTTDPAAYTRNYIKAQKDKAAEFAKAATRTTTLHSLLANSTATAKDLFETLRQYADVAREAGVKDEGLDKQLHLGTLQRALLPSIVGRISKLAGDVTVHVVPDAEFDRIHGSLGVKGNYNSVTHTIVLRESSANDPHVVVHEAVHAAFLQALEANPRLKEIVVDIMQQAQDAGAVLGGGDYALTNPDEFVAEALSKTEFQDFLAKTPASPKTIERLGLAKVAHSMWDAIVAIARQAFGLPDSSQSLLHAMLRVAHELDKSVRTAEPTGRARPMREGELVNMVHRINRKINRKIDEHVSRNFDVGAHAEKIVDNVRTAAEDAVGRVTGKDRVDTGLTPKFMPVRTFDHLATAAKELHTFVGEPVRKAFNAMQRINTAAERLQEKWKPALVNLQDMMSKYRGPVADEFASLMHDSTIAGVWPNKGLDHVDNKHVSKKGYTDQWQRTAHAELSARFAKLPAELKAAFATQAAHFGEAQNAAALGVAKNRILTYLGVADDALAQRILDGTHTPADEAALGDTFEVIKNSGMLNTANGPYFPLIRHGDFIVRGHHTIADPASSGYLGREDPAKGAGAYVFNVKDAATKFADDTYNAKGLKPTVDGKWVDKTTGSIWGTDPVTGDKTRITEKDVDAEHRYYVKIQNQHTEFVGTKDAAQKLAHQLQADGMQGVDVQPREVIQGRPNGSFMSKDLQAVLKQIEGTQSFKDMTPTQQAEVHAAVDHMAVRLLGENRVQSRSLPRRGVAGASHDVVKSTVVYNSAMSHYLGRLEHGPALNEAMTDMHNQARNDGGKPNSYGRMSVYNEINKRVNSFDPMAGDTGKFAPVVKRAMILSYLTRMFSPMHSVINMAQPAMMQFPVLAGRHGVGSAARALAKAYADIGTLDAFKEGLVATAHHTTNPNSTRGSSLVETMKGKLKDAGERSMIDFLVTHGSINPDSGFEIAHMTSDASGPVGVVVDKATNYLDNIARQMPKAVEAVNRFSSGLAAYRLELAKTGDHDAAVQYAQETVNMSQGDYSNLNAAPIFNHPLARISLQFKKYGQMVYGLIGHEIGKAINNANPGDRAEAVKTLFTLAAMHIAVAGTLGLPTEPIKWLLNIANAAGLTDYKWADVDNLEREVLAHVAGKGLGEVLAHGVTRAIPGGFAFDTTSRLGLNDLFTFGEPASNKPADIMSYIGTLVGGAPVGLGMSYVSAAQALAKGDIATAAKLTVPMKAAADAIAAYQKMTQGKVSKSGNQTMEPYSLQEALVRTFGATPKREAENSDLQNSVYEQTQRQTGQRTDLQQQWYKASPADRMRLWGNIEKWNAGQTPANKLTRAHLSDYVARRKRDITDGRVTNGLLVTPKNRNVMAAASRTYNN